jgi:hypothetical protein
VTICNRCANLVRCAGVSVNCVRFRPMLPSISLISVSINGLQRHISSDTVLFTGRRPWPPTVWKPAGCPIIANMDWVGVAKIGLALKVEWGPVFAGESWEEAYRYGSESIRGQRRPTVIPCQKLR